MCMFAFWTSISYLPPPPPLFFTIYQLHTPFLNTISKLSIKPNLIILFQSIGKPFKSNRSHKTVWFYDPSYLFNPSPDWSILINKCHFLINRSRISGRVGPADWVHQGSSKYWTDKVGGGGGIREDVLRIHIWQSKILSLILKNTPFLKWFDYYIFNHHC